MQPVADALITTHQVFLLFQKERKAVMHHLCLKLKRFSATDVFICDLEVVEVY